MSVTAEATTTTVVVSIQGSAPLLMHNGHTADPLNRFAKAMKAINAKRNKTDEDREVIANLEWWAGLYLSERAVPSADGATVETPASSRVVVPAHVIAAALHAGARKLKRGKDLSAGVVVEDDAELEHDGPKNVNDLANDDRFRHAATVKVSTSRVVRVRPVFPTWGLTFSVSVEPDIMNPSEIREVVEAAGKYGGIGDWRPNAPRGGSFGRFVVRECA